MNGTTITKKQNKLLMPLVQVRQKAQITLPQKVRHVLGIKEGDYLEVRLEDDKLILQPKVLLDRFPEIELSPKGERMLQESLNDVKKGVHLQAYDNAEDLIEALHRKSSVAKKKTKKSF